MELQLLTTVFPKLSPNFGYASYFPFIKIKGLRYSRDRKRLLVSAVFSRLIPVRIERAIEEELTNVYFPDRSVRVAFLTEYELSDAYQPKHLIEEFKDELSEMIADGSPATLRILKAGEWTAESDDGVKIRVDESLLSSSRKDEWAEKLSSVFLNRFHYSLSVHIEERKAKRKIHADESEFFMAMNQPAKETVPDTPASESIPASVEEKSALPESETVQKTVPETSSLRKGTGKSGKVKKTPENKGREDYMLYGRPFRDETVPISSILPEEEGSVSIRGRVCNLNVLPLKKKPKTIVSFAVTDYTDSITVKLFADNEEVDGLLKQLTEGCFVRLKGRAGFDTFEKESAVVSVYGMELIPAFYDESREDRAEVKRVELHCHTNMSESDAVSPAAEIVHQAASWGHSAIAVTDHGVIYAFPEAMHAAEKWNGEQKEKKTQKPPFKVIYGMEGYLVDDTLEAVVNPENRALSDTFVVFDLETTGLSPVDCRIIEIGAVKVENGVITDRFGSFVNPGVPIPLRIEMETHISDEMVKDAPPISEVLPRFMEFIGDAALVAHNATFDVSFLRENLKKLGALPSKPFTYLDTLGIARSLLPKLSNYRLDTIAKELNIVLNDHHRAVNDAECTAEIFIAFINRLNRKGWKTLEEVRLATRLTKEAKRKLHSSHVIILVKNETGRVNLYRLVTESSLTYFNKRPLIPKTLLNEYREGLIVGSACSMGELYNAVMEGATEEELARIVSFYDYLEVQPIENDSYLLRDPKNDLVTEQDLIDISRKIVSLGDQFKKPVVATSDVHFLHPGDALYREMLQFGKGFPDAENQPPLYLRTTEEMLAAFEFLGSDKAYEIVVTNTNRIADEIEVISPIYTKNGKVVKCPPVIENSDEALRTACYKRAHEIYGDPLPKIVEERLEKELSSIIGNGYAVMYMIAEKLVSKSVSDGYLVGSRGSVGSSFAATMSGITEVNPLKPHYVCPKCRYSDFDSEIVRKYEKYAGCDLPDRECPVCGTKLKKDGFNIPFETFLGFKGDKEPDIDLNFSGEYQSKAHAYTEVIFGKGQTFRAGTYGGIAEKTAFGYVKHYYDEHGEKKRKCEIERLAKKLEGIRRTSGQHPGGIVVLPIGVDINTITPIQHPANDMNTPIITTHFEYHAIDGNLLKLDILGHDDPTMIRMLQELTGVDPRTFPLDSKEVMSLFESTEALGITPEDIRGCKIGALGIPEFGTDFAMGMVIACKPKRLTDLVRITGMAHGTDVWSNNNQILFEEGTVTLETAICCRDDIMEYLISMGLESSLAFEIMEKVRKGKGLKPEWEEEMCSHGVPDWYIWSCNKIKYMFPKAHAAAYVMMAWRIAYCKVFYPLEYYCSYYSVRADGFNYEKMCLGEDRLITYMEQFERIPKPSDKEKLEFRDMRIVQEMYARGFAFVPIDLETVKATEFQITEDRKIMPSLTSIADLGESAADSIVEAVHDGLGPFTSESNFRTRAHVSQSIVDRLKALGILSGLPSDDQFSLFDQLGV